MQRSGSGYLYLMYSPKKDQVRHWVVKRSSLQEEVMVFVKDVICYILAAYPEQELGHYIACQTLFTQGIKMIRTRLQSLSLSSGIAWLGKRF